MGNTTGPGGGPSAKRIKLYDADDDQLVVAAVGPCLIYDLPDDLKRALIKYNTNNALSATCRAFRALWNTLTPYKVEISEFTRDTVMCYPPDTTNTARVVLRDDMFEVRSALRKHGFSKTRPRFPHATALEVDGIVPMLSRGTPSEWFSLIRSLVCIKNIYSLDIQDVLEPLAILARFHAAGAFPTKVKLSLPDEHPAHLGTLKRVKKLYLAIHTLNDPAIPWLRTHDLCPTIETLIISLPHATSRVTALLRLLKRYPTIRKLNIGESTRTRITLSDALSLELCRALMRGGYTPLKLSWREKIECLDDTMRYSTRLTEWLMTDASPIPRSAQIPHHAMLVTLKRQRCYNPCHLLDQSYPIVAQHAILEEAPTKAKYTLAEWTAMRASALVLLSFTYWDTPDTYTLLLRIWTQCCAASNTRKVFVRAALQEMEYELFGYNKYTFAPRRSRLGLKFVANLVVPCAFKVFVSKDVRASLIARLKEYKHHTAWRPRETLRHLDGVVCTT